MGMEIVGDQFIDYGNAQECTEPVIQGYEILACGIARLFVCKKVAGQMVLDHTDVASVQTLLALSKRLREIALDLETYAVSSAAPPPLLALHKAH